MISKMKIIIKKNTHIYNFILFILNTYCRFLQVIISLLFKVEKKAVFISFGGKTYSCTPRAISEELHRQAPEIKIVWVFNDPESKKNIVPEYVKCVKNRTLKYYYEMTTAKFWIDSFPKSPFLLKRKNQVYIYGFHGERGFKRVYLDSTHVVQNFKLLESEGVDLFLTGSEFGNKMVRSAYGYNGQIMEYGCPRCDVLLKNSEETAQLRKNIKDRINISHDAKILLYCPTLRRKLVASGKPQSVGDINLTEILDELENKTKNKWVCLVRAHTTIGYFDKNNFGDPRIIDVSKYEDSQDLLLISDFHITDYSSTCGDFILTDNPVILFHADLDLYLKYDRSFYFDPKESPFNIAYNQEDLTRLIQEMDFAEEAQRNRKIREFYGVFETGNASKNVVNFMINEVNK